MNLTVSSAPHIRGEENTRRIMLDVLIALVPALIAAVILFGLRALVLTAVSAAACVIFPICGLKRKNCFIKLLLKDILFLEIIQWQVICFILQQTNSN